MSHREGLPLYYLQETLTTVRAISWLMPCVDHKKNEKAMTSMTSHADYFKLHVPHCAATACLATRAARAFLFWNTLP